jgi:hypothetical protein
MTLSTYAHVFDEFALAGRGSAEEEILRARGEDVPVCTLSGRRLRR